jgi:hypothetical protein
VTIPGIVADFACDSLAIMRVRSSNASIRNTIGVGDLNSTPLQLADKTGTQIVYVRSKVVGLKW